MKYTDYEKDIELNKKIEQISKQIFLLEQEKTRLLIEKENKENERSEIKK